VLIAASRWHGLLDELYDGWLHFHSCRILRTAHFNCRWSRLHYPIDLPWPGRECIFRRLRYNPRTMSVHKTWTTCHNLIRKWWVELRKPFHQYIRNKNPSTHTQLAVICAKNIH
jgi:hypothetical protein